MSSLDMSEYKSASASLVVSYLQHDQIRKQIGSFYQLKKYVSENNIKYTSSKKVQSDVHKYLICYLKGSNKTLKLVTVSYDPINNKFESSVCKDLLNEIFIVNKNNNNYLKISVIKKILNLEYGEDMLISAFQIMDLDPNIIASNKTPLVIIAGHRQKYKLLEYLLNKGAQIHNMFGFIFDKNGDTVFGKKKDSGANFIETFNWLLLYYTEKNDEYMISNLNRLVNK